MQLIIFERIIFDDTNDGISLRAIIISYIIDAHAQERERLPVASFKSRETKCDSRARAVITTIVGKHAILMPLGYVRTEIIPRNKGDSWSLRREPRATSPALLLSIEQKNVALSGAKSEMHPGRRPFCFLFNFIYIVPHIHLRIPPPSHSALRLSLSSPCPLLAIRSCD